MLRRFHNISRGFSLIELMMVIAIIAVLASVAIPRYQEYVQRSHVNTSLAYTRPLQLALAEYLSIHAEFPPDIESLSRYQIPAQNEQDTSDTIEHITYRGGANPAIVLRYGQGNRVPAPLRGQTLALALSINRNGLLDMSVDEQSTLPAHLFPRM